LFVFRRPNAILLILKIVLMFGVIVMCSGSIPFRIIEVKVLFVFRVSRVDRNKKWIFLMSMA